MKKIAIMSGLLLSSVIILFSCKKKEQKGSYTCTCPCIIENGIAATPVPVEILNVTADEASLRCQAQTNAFNQNRKAAGKSEVGENYVCKLERMLE